MATVVVMAGEIADKEEGEIADKEEDEIDKDKTGEADAEVKIKQHWILFYSGMAKAIFWWAW